VFLIKLIHSDSGNLLQCVLSHYSAENMRNFSLVRHSEKFPKYLLQITEFAVSKITVPMIGHN
jgi:hypothetical protein